MSDQQDYDDHIVLFRVLFNEERTRIETDHDVMGWGIRFPSGRCYVDWNREAYPPEDRLDHTHVSDYGSLADVRQGTGGDVEITYERPINRYLAADDADLASRSALSTSGDPSEGRLDPQGAETEVGAVETVACVHCKAPMASLSEASEHHSARHPGELFDPAWYAELVEGDG